MKDTVIRRNGKSRKIKAPSDMPTTYEAFRAAMIKGKGFFDIETNTDTSSNGGVLTLGTPLSKLTLLTDRTRDALGLKQADPTVDDALYALYTKLPKSTVTIRTVPNRDIKIKNDLSGEEYTKRSDKYGGVSFMVTALGRWVCSAYSGSSVEWATPFELNSISAITVNSYPSFASAKWDTLHEMSKSGVMPKVYRIGDKRTDVAPDGTRITYRIIGFDHDKSIFNPSSVGTTTLETVESYVEAMGMNFNGTNVGGWESSQVRRELQRNVVSRYMSTELQSVLTTVFKYTSGGSSNQSIVRTEDNVFLLSESEIFGRNTHSLPGEGDIYQYYFEGGVKIKEYNGVNWSYWTRSATVGAESTGFVSVGSKGSATTAIASNKYPLPFAICI